MNFVSSITLAFKDAFSSGFNEAKDSLAGMKGALDEINQNQSMNRLAADMAMMTAMTDPMRRALSEAMDQPSKIAGSLDSSFRSLQVSAGLTNEEMVVMRRELLAIGGRAVAGPEAVAGAFANVADSISDASKHMAVMNAAVALSEANQADLGMSTDALINVTNAWNLSADQAAIAADILTQTALAGVGSVGDFAGSISNISALAASAGIGLDELGASFAFVTNKGFSASQAQKQFKGIISTLVSPSETLANLYESLGIESGQAMLQQYGLAESLYIIKNALGDNEQAFASIIGSAEAATVALALTEDAYVDFATSFGEGMVGITEAARGVQLESIEAKMARLDSASKALQAQIGQDINGIKGFFIDMKFGFLSNVVSPIMASPVGGAVSKIAAVTGMAAKTMLDMGSGALTAATQMTTLAANISNAGGIAKLFKNGVGLMGSSLKILGSPLKAAGAGIVGIGKSIIGALPAMGSYIASMWASVAPTLAATWPILAIIAAVALLAGGVYLLIKNWDKVSAFFVNLWEKVKSIFSAVWNWIKDLFLKFHPVGLVVKHWDTIKGFFINLWENIKGIFSAVWEWIKGLFLNYHPIGLVIKHWDTIKEFFVNLWENVKNIFSAAWNWIKELFLNYTPAGLIIKHWETIKEFFVNLWDSIKSVFQGFIDWIGGKVEAFIAPFKAIGDVVGGVFNKVGGFIGGLFGGGKQAGSDLNDAFASGIQSNAAAPGDAFNSSLQGINRQLPHSDAYEGPLSQLTASGRALTDTFASGMDEDALRDKASLVFSAAMPLDYPAIEQQGSQGGSQSITIQNLYLQAEECESLFDFVRMIMGSVHRPEGVPA